MANEVTTGMGRTGKWFGFQHYEMQPDIRFLETLQNTLNAVEAGL